MSKIMTPKVVVPSAFVVKAEIGDKVWTMIENIPTEVAVASHVVAFSKLKKSSNEVVEKLTYRCVFYGEDRDIETTILSDDDIFTSLEELLSHLRVMAHGLSKI